MFLVIFNNDRQPQTVGDTPWGVVISRHRTLSGAQRSFHQRNPHLFNRRWAEAHGYTNTGTFDEIIEVDRNGRFLAYC